MIWVIVAIVIAGIVFAILNKSNPVPPPVDTEETLMEEGMTKSQARKELRAQRAEYRSSQRLRNNNLRAATKVANSIVRIARKR